jgi:hypothetical protein
MSISLICYLCRCSMTDYIALTIEKLELAQWWSCKIMQAFQPVWASEPGLGDLYKLSSPTYYLFSLIWTVYYLHYFFSVICTSFSLHCPKIVLFILKKITVLCFIKFGLKKGVLRQNKVGALVRHSRFGSESRLLCNIFWILYENKTVKKQILILERKVACGVHVLDWWSKNQTNLVFE